MLYLDSAATTFQKPAAVQRAVVQAMRTMSSPGRGGYESARLAEETLFRCRSAAAALFSVPSAEQVVFTMNATHALNIAVKSLVRPGGRAIVSGYEHNAVTRPLHALEAEVIVAAAPLFSPQETVEAFERALAHEPDAVICTHVSNVFGAILPIERIAQLCRGASVPLIIDATTATPYLIHPFDFGADIVVHSSSKYINGGGNSISGIIIDSGSFKWNCERYAGLAEYKKFGKFAYIAKLRNGIWRNVGGCLAPMNAFMNSVGLETMGLRMERSCSNALALAKFFESCEGIEVNYPALESSPFYPLCKKQLNGMGGAIVTIRAGSKERAFKLINGLKLAVNATNIGDVRTLVIHPASTIYTPSSEKQQLSAGVYGDTIRISVGIEDAEDLIQDFKQSIENI